MSRPFAISLAALQSGLVDAYARGHGATRLIAIWRQGWKPPYQLPPLLWRRLLQTIASLVLKAVNGYFGVEREVREENIRDAILQSVSEQTSSRGYVDVASLLKTLDTRFSFNSLLDAMDAMAKEGDLMTLGVDKRFGANAIGPSAQIMITNRGRQALSKKSEQPES